MNTVYVILNVMVTATPTRVYHFIHSIIFGLIFILFTVIYYFEGGTDDQGNRYIYDLLNWNDPGIATLASVVTIFVILPVAHVGYYGLYKLSTLYPDCNSKVVDNRNDPQTGRTNEVV